MIEKAEGIGELLNDLKKNTFQKYDAFTVGEVFNLKEGELPRFIGEDGYFSTMFDFSAHILSDGRNGWYDAPSVDFKMWRKAIIHSQLDVQKVGLEANIIENHDEPRGASRFLPDYARTPAGIKMLGTVSILLRGIPFIYQGQEIGMQNAKWNSLEEFDDISTKDQYTIAMKAGLSRDEAMKVCSKMSRDNARTPFQWTAGENAGFTAGTPWLKINSNYKDINVENQEKDEDSVLNYYRRLVALRKSNEYKDIFTYGEFEPVYENTETIMAYYRIKGEKRMLTAANFGREPAEVNLEYTVKSVVLSNRTEKNEQIPAKTLRLESCEAIVLEC